MNYTKCIDGFTTPPDSYVKCFYSVPNIKPHPDSVFELVENRTISEKELDLLTFLFRVQFATFSQLVKYCDLKGYSSLKKKLDFLCKKGVLLRFIFIDEYGNNSFIPQDALVVYCLSDSGKAIIERYTSVFTYNWTYSVQYQNTGNVSDRLVNTEFYLHVLSSDKAKVTDISSDYMLSYKRNILRADMVYRVLSLNQIYYVIANVIHPGTDVFSLRDLIHNYESFFATNLYKRFFPDAAAIPYVILICDNDQELMNVCNEVIETSRMSNVLYTTPSRFELGLTHAGAFLVYNESSNQITDAVFQMF